MNQIIRPEIHTRTRFAYEQAEIYLKKIPNLLNGGNILTGKHTRKFLQARRIYVHYCNEFQSAMGLAKTK